MMMVSEIYRKYSSKLFERARAGGMFIVSLFICCGLFLSLSSAFFLRDHLLPGAHSLSFTGRLLLIYFSLTILFAVGLSQAGFAVIPIMSLFMGLTASFVLYTGINGDAVDFIFRDLPFVALLLVSFVVYGANQLKTSWLFFSGNDCPDVLDTLQQNIKLYYFTLTVFALMTAVISGLGYLIPFLYRSLF